MNNERFSVTSSDGEYWVRPKHSLSVESGVAHIGERTGSWLVSHVSFDSLGRRCTRFVCEVFGNASYDAEEVAKRVATSLAAGSLLAS